jgi:YVTN family beta-propeller protein
MEMTNGTERIFSGNGSRLPAAGMIVLAAALAFSGQANLPIRKVKIFDPPGVTQRPHLDERTGLLINGRTVTPAGRMTKLQSYSWGMAINQDGTQAALVNRDAVTLLTLAADIKSRRIPPFGVKAAKAMGDGSYMGCAFSPDGRLLYYGSANQGQIKVLDVRSGRVRTSININGSGYGDSFVGDFVLSLDGRRLYAVDQHNYRMVTVDLSTKKVVQSVRVGRNPFGIRLSKDERHAWVSNVGMFEYPLLPGVTPSTRRQAGLSFPAYGIPSREAEEGTQAEGQFVPGLGSPNHPDAMSVFKVNLATGMVEKKVKTGYLVGVERDDIQTVGGASPSSVAIGEKHIYVSMREAIRSWARLS